VGFFLGVTIQKNIMKFVVKKKQLCIFTADREADGNKFGVGNNYSLSSKDVYSSKHSNH